MGDLPTTVWSGSFNIFGIDVKCHTLSDGQRIIEEDSVKALFGAMIDRPNVSPKDELAQLSEWMHGNG